MRFLRPLVRAVWLFGALGLTACDETPRGEQGVDFLDEGGVYTVPPAPDAGPDAIGPCANEVDTTSLCTSTSVGGIPYSNLVACSGTAPPADITCVSATGTPDGGLTVYCCSTGIL